MSAARRTKLTLSILALAGAAWSAGALLDVPGRCAVAPVAAQGHGGCCYYNTGVCDCENGRARCCDGTVSASCHCGADRLRTRDIFIPTQKPLRLADVAFTTQESSEPPSPRLRFFRLAADALRFWFRIDCGEGCWSRVSANDTLAVEVRWLFDSGARPVLDETSQSVMLPRGRSSVFVARPVSRLRPGWWETEVRFGTDRLCIRDDDRSCWFPIEVRR